MEKETEVCEDPRGIVVNGDAVRISHQIGVGEALTKKIGKGGCNNQCLSITVKLTLVDRHWGPDLPPRKF